ncbi:hypothetical protein [Uliginosibacterium sediminicola]|uniref:REJ domain-containing protein n=1 Tax=Uliginosibacterium sediminicola TaxID=2024550 RepID=A0ABU9YZI6_9RHOO
MTSTNSGLSIDALVYSPSAPRSGYPVSVSASVTASSELAAAGIRYVWTQTSGPALALTGTTAESVSFTAPTVSSTSNVVLSLSVSAGSLSATRSILISIEP